MRYPVGRVWWMAEVRQTHPDVREVMVRKGRIWLNRMDCEDGTRMKKRTMWMDDLTMLAQTLAKAPCTLLLEALPEKQIGQIELTDVTKEVRW